MKRLLVVVFSLLVFAALNAWPQMTPGEKPGKQRGATSPAETKSTSPGAKQTTLRGTVSDDGKTIVADKDKKSWTVSNPDALKGHEGHHVSVSGHADAAKNEIHVLSVKMAGGKKKTTT